MWQTMTQRSTTQQASRAAMLAAAPVVLEAVGIEKTFHIPTHRVDTVKERVAHPFARHEHRLLRALSGVSFEVRRGEFFGIVGRNGSGKSTLLKILASIYRADSGRIRIAGRLAPFIELGVGFNPELTARENVALNGVMMGLTRREAEHRLDTVLDFAELDEFVDLKLKNYSSGMLVRLAFAVMVQADADIMLIDEVLAVGDAAFAQKCMDVFAQKRDAGKTLVLVTHDMATVQSFCDRAMLLHDGKQHYTGQPEETVLRYFRMNFGGAEEAERERATSFPDVNVALVDFWFEDRDGSRIDNVEQGDPIRLHMIAEARQQLVRPVFSFHFLSPEGAWIFRSAVTVAADAGGPERVEAGERIEISGTIENPLLPGRYLVECWITREQGEDQMALHVLRLLNFLVYGTRQGAGSVSLAAEVRAVVEPRR
jgi:ABC-type polysaccharide/polyol phosphate transport system ATPase subunit